MDENAFSTALLYLMRDTPLWLIGFIVTVIVVGYAVGLMLLTRFQFGADRLKENNEVAGFKYAVVDESESKVLDAKSMSKKAIGAEGGNQ